MRFLPRLKIPRFWASRGASQPTDAQAIIDRATVSTGRKAIDTSTSSSQQSFLPRSEAEYHARNLDSLAAMGSQDLLKLLFRIDSTASHALSNFLRIFDSGYFMVAKDFEGKPLEPAQQFLDGLIGRYERPVIEGFSGDTSISALYCNSIVYALFTGAIAAEVEFDPGYVNLGIHLIDPLLIQFREEDSGGTRRNVPYYVSGRDRIPLDFKNFLYFPIDPMPGDVYGTSQFLSAIVPILSKVRLLQDFARALRNLGFDRIDITIEEEALIDACRKKGIKDPEKIEEVINRVVEQARDSFASMEVDDNPAHLSSIQLAPLEGKNSGRQLDIGAIVNILMSDIASGLKTFATILGKAFGRSTEGYQSVEALLYMRMVEGFQNIIKRFMERVFTLIVQVEGGFQANVDFEFMEASIRPIYESAQYYAAYQHMLFEAEKLGHISQAENSRRVRRMLKLRGEPPPDAIRDENFSPTTPNSPQRDASQESDKETRRASTNRERRTSSPSPRSTN